MASENGLSRSVELVDARRSSQVKLCEAPLSARLASTQLLGDD